MLKMTKTLLSKHGVHLSRSTCIRMEVSAQAQLTHLAQYFLFNLIVITSIVLEYSQQSVAYSRLLQWH